MDYLKKYEYTPAGKEIVNTIQSIADGVDAFGTPEVYGKCFSFMDLTTLKTDDTAVSVKKFVEKVNGLADKYPDYPMPASVCVYPNFVSEVCSARKNPDLRVTAVSACFPSAQSFIEVKIKECELAVRNGADEVDIVLPLNLFLAGDCEAASAEISAIRAAVDAEGAARGRKITLKVILETGLLPDASDIAAASFLAMESGADFIKTSTGKVEVNATPMAAFVMCGCIRRFYEKTGKKVGFKAAGGISSAKDALNYYCIVSSVLGSGWLNRELFRFGVSRLANSLMSAIERKTVKYF